jgi:hypothetical protein
MQFLTDTGAATDVTCSSCKDLAILHVPECQDEPVMLDTHSLCRRKCVFDATILIFGIAPYGHPARVNSQEFYFPEQLQIKNATFVMVSRILTTKDTGQHFYNLSRFNRPDKCNEGAINGVFRHDGASNGGYSIREASDCGLEGRNALSPVVYYVKI